MLNERQTRFCDEYLANGGNAYQAALAAGYADKTAIMASKWLAKNPKKPNKKYNAEMAAYIAAQSDALEKHNDKIASAEDVQEFVSSVMKGDAQEVVVTERGDKVNVPANVRDRLRAADILAKMKGMYNEKITAEIQEVVIIDDF